MKLAYERPVMRAEMFQTNAYCASGCDESATQGQMGMSGADLSKGIWYHVPSAGSSFPQGNQIAHTSTDFSLYSNLVFGGVQHPMTGSDGVTQQFYWTTSYGGKTYHLEYSNGSGSWTDKWNSNSNQLDNPGDMVFVLYEEENNTGDLEANVYWSNDTNPGYFPGSQSDGSNWDPKNKFDNAILAVIFGASQVKFYWS